MNEKENDQKPNYGKFIGLAIVLMISQPLLFIPLAIFGGIGYAVYRGIIKPAQTSQSPQTGQAAFDDCPQSLFCFHKDKGEHHVARGREIDPWDRPDIDIRKYQRKER